MTGVPTIATKPEGSETRTKVRFGIIAMVFVISALNNADRATLAITGTAMQEHLGFGAVTLGYLFSAFAWSYMLAQLPGGWLMDRFGTKPVYAASIFLWSVFTFLQGFVHFFSLPSAIVALFILRICVGAAEGPAFPGNSRLVSSWFPAAERGTAAAIFNSAQYFSTVAFLPLMGWIVTAFGWSYVYLIMGVLGMVLTAVWMAVIHAPRRHPRINAAELDYMVEGGALIDLDDRSPVNRANSPRAWPVLKQLLTSRMMLGVYLGQFFITGLVYFFLTWFPIYLVKGLGISIINAGFLAAVPAICGFLGGVIGGVFSDTLLRRGWSIAAARKTPVVIGMVMAASIILCIWASSVTMVIALMSVALFGKGLGSLGWAVVSDTSPKEAGGLSGALFNTFANAAGITTPIVIGYMVEATGNFDMALVFVAANAVGATLCYLFIVGPIRRIELDPATLRGIAPEPETVRLAH